jgi:ribA/ribD-fused uncharacterized protein
MAKTPKRRRRSSKQTTQLNPAKKQNVDMAEAHTSAVGPSISIDSIKQVMTDAIDEMVKKYEIHRIGLELKEIKEGMEFIHSKSDTALTKANEAKEEIEQLKEEVHSLEKRLVEEKKWRLRMETEQRYRSLKLIGLKESMGGDTNVACLKKVQGFVEDTMELQNVKIASSFRLGKWKENQKEPRNILVNFATDADRVRVWEAKNKLAKSNIYLREDLPLDVERNASQLAPLLMGARKRGMKANLYRDNLYINNQKFRLDSLHRMKGDIAPERLTTYETDECIFFWSKYSPLSNFSQDYSFIYETVRFTSVEQAYCYSKAVHYKDTAAMAKIKLLSDPVDIKRTKIEGLNITEWEKEAENKMLDIIRSKVSQTPEFREILKATKPKTLCEAVTHEKTWGIGMNILHKELNDKGKWGKNRLGHLLQSVRETL